jgi:hypothetical protein
MINYKEEVLKKYPDAYSELAEDKVWDIWAKTEIDFEEVLSFSDVEEDAWEKAYYDWCEEN